MKIKITLENLSLSELAKVYNCFSSTKVNRFSNKSAGIRRTNEAIETFSKAQNSVEDVVKFYEDSSEDLPAIFEFDLEQQPKETKKKPSPQTDKVKAADRPVDLKVYNKLSKKAPKFKLGAEEIEDKNYCALLAVAQLTEEDYETVFLAFRNAGRKTGRGSNYPVVEAALFELGYKIEEFKFHDASEYPGCHGVLLKNVTSFHPKRFPEFFKELPNLYCVSAKHAFAIIDGQTKDWSHEKYLRIKNAYTITPMTTEEYNEAIGAA